VELLSQPVSVATVKPPTKIVSSNPSIDSNQSTAVISLNSTASLNSTLPEQEQIENMILGWASAWSAQEVNLYLSFYSKNFVPADSQTRTRWEQARTKRLTLPRWVTVNVSDMKIMPSTSKKASVIFKQNYRSSRYSEQSKKELVLEYVDGLWLIVKENTL